MDEEKRPDRNRELTPKQRRFVAEYTNPESPAFGNATAAYRLTYDVDPDGVSHQVAASRLKRRAHIARAIDESLKTNQFDVDSRIKVIAEIGLGVLETEESVLDKNGNERVLYKKPTMSERLKAIEIANRMDGTYEKQRVRADVAREEAMALQKQILKEVQG